MNITTPSEMASDQSQLQSAISEFEKAFKKEEIGRNFYHLIALREYNKVVCKEIAHLYEQAGWVNVECRTSSDNGERPGLTGLILYRKVN